MAKLKRGEIDGQHSRQMFEQILSLHHRHEATQKVILENQKKIKKALLKHKVRSDCIEIFNHVSFGFRSTLTLKKISILLKVLKQVNMKIYSHPNW